MKSKLLTKPEAAERLTVSVRTLEGLIARGALPAYRIAPNTVRLKESDVEDYIEARLVAPAKKPKPAAAPIQRPCLYVPGMKVV